MTDLDHRLSSPFSASGLNLVEFRCSDCGARWWIESSAADREGSWGQCGHPANDRRRTGYEHHIRMVDFEVREEINNGGKE